MIQKLKNRIRIFLRWTERWTKTDMVYLTTGGFWLISAQVLSSLTSFILAIAFANLLPKETYGTYKYILSIFSLLCIFTLTGIGTSISRAAAQAYDGSIVSMIKSRIKWGVIGTIVSLAIALYYYLNNNTTLTFCFLITSIFIPFMEPFSSFYSILLGKKKFKLSTTYDIIINALTFVAIITALFFTKNLFIILLSYFCAYTLFRYIFLLISLKKIIKNNEKDDRALSYGKHLSLMGILSTVAAQIDKVLVFQFLGAGQLAIYSVAIAIPEQTKGFLKNIEVLALPKFAEKSYQKIKPVLYKKMMVFGFIVIPIIVIYFIAAPYIFKILFPKYLSGVWYSQLFSVSLITIVSIIPSAYLRASAQKNILYKINIISSVVQILSIIPFLYFWGLLGLIIARVITRFITLLIILGLVKRAKNLGQT